MAQIDLKTIKRIDKDRNAVHTEVQTTYTSFVADGKKYFQIDIYGKVQREMPGKISQSIQLNKDSALFLIKLLKQEFDV